jgi:hypothetical protein
MSLLQNPVGFASAFAVSRRRTFGSRAAKHGFLSGCFPKTNRVLKLARIYGGKLWKKKE